MVKFNIELTGEDGAKIGFTAYRSDLWKALDAAASFPEPTAGARRDYAFVYFAAKRAGMLGELGIPDEASLGDAVELLADAYDLDYSETSTSDPLASERGK